MRLYFAFFFLLFVSSHTFGQRAHIGILRQYKLKQINFTPFQGSYVLFKDTVIIDTIDSEDKINIDLLGENIRIVKNEKILGIFSTIGLKAIGNNSAMRVKPVIPNANEHKYADDFHIFIANNRLNLINDVSLRHYIAGVVESEGGGQQNIEYYKVQAIISRTYAVKNEFRHKSEGFELCDGVHCQAYNNMLRFTPDIQSAVDATKEIVLTDSSGQLIDAFFHANCGGQTSPAEYVWNTPLNYLHTFVDTFCMRTAQANWKNTISKKDWANFLLTKYAYPIQDTSWGAHIFSFTQEKRMAFYIDPSLGIPLRDLRTKFHLKSTFFSCHPEGDFVVLEGKGYGHGVGLCQEGAMNMANQGYRFDQIIKFYYYGVQLCLFNNIHYFNQVVNSPFDF
jgi:stage II sporulation protein D